MKLTQVTYSGSTRELHVNPRYVTRAWPDSREILTLDMGEQEYPIELTQESMDELIAWMEENC